MVRLHIAFRIWNDGLGNHKVAMIMMVALFNGHDSDHDHDLDSGSYQAKEGAKYEKEKLHEARQMWDCAPFRKI